MTLALRFLDDVDARLKPEVVAFGRWLRESYPFPHPLEIRLVNRATLVDDDGVACALRWWQRSADREAVTAEIAVASFAENLRTDGPTVAFPTVIAALGRVVKYYYQSIRGEPSDEDEATEWGDRVLAAYVDETSRPEPWRGAGTEQ